MRLLLLFVLAAALSPAAILRLHFTGTIRPGTATGSTFDLATGSGLRVDIGTSVLGYLDLDYSALPPPTVTNNSGNVIHEFLSTSLNPTFLAFSLQLNFTPPTNTLPIPTAVTSTRWLPTPLDTEVTPTELRQEVRMQSAADSRSFTFVSAANFTTATGDFRQQNKTLAILLDGLPAITPNGASDFPIVIPNLKSGFFLQQQVARGTDRQQGLFGMVESSLLTAQFDITSVRGEVITPEPATWLLAAPAVIWMISRKRARA